jgi:DNA-binding transcriptional LysR family regulator
MNDLDLNDVRTFVSVAQAGTLTAAAKEMACPVSTVSRALTRLEKHLAVLLVHRGPRGLVLTDAGKEYLQSCRRALQSLQHGRDVLEGHRSSPSGLLKVACPVTMARDAIAPLLKEFLERYPELRVEIEPYAASWDQEPRDDVDVFFKLRAPKDSCGACAHIQGRFEDFLPAKTILKALEIYRPRMTSRSTTASAPDPGS